MAIGSGLAGSLGIVAETTYGTPVTVSKFLEVSKVDLKKVKNTAQGGGLKAGALAQPVNRRVVTTTAAAGGLEGEVVNKNMGLLLQALMGTTVTPTQVGTTGAYVQTHTLADNAGKSLTAQVGVPLTTGTVQPYTYAGVKVMGAEFSCGVDDLLTASFDLDAKSVTDQTALASPSYSTGVRPFHFGQMGVKIGTFGAEAAVSGVRSVNVKIDRPQNVDRYYANGNGTKAEPILNGWTSITGAIETDFLTKADFADRFDTDGSFSLVWEFVGVTISGAEKETFRITIPSCFLNDGTPTLEGPDIVAPAFNFVWQYDGTNLPVITYESTDLAL